MVKFGQQEVERPRGEVYSINYTHNALPDAGIRDMEQFAQQAGFESAQVGAGSDGEVNGWIRRSNVAWLHPDKLPQEVLKHFEALTLAANDQGYKFDLSGFEAFQFTVYDEKMAGEYKWHVDTAPLPDGSIRKLSMSLLLSDPSEFEGGKLLVNAGGNPIVAEERKGRAVFFPSWMPHCVTPVTKGIRKSLVIWTHGPAFK